MFDHSALMRREPVGFEDGVVGSFRLRRRRGGRDGEPGSCRGSGLGPPVPLPLLDLGLNPAERGIEILHYFAERGGQRRPPADQHVIVPGI